MNSELRLKEQNLLKTTEEYHIDNSQQSTTAGETSGDEEFLDIRLSSPGLTMQGMVDDDMFDACLEGGDFSSN